MPFLLSNKYNINNMLPITHEMNKFKAGYDCRVIIILIMYPDHVREITPITCVTTETGGRVMNSHSTYPHQLITTDILPTAD